MAANDIKAPIADEIDDLAFQIFTARAAAAPSRQGGERDAVESYRLAESFITVRRKVKAGELKPKEVPTGPQLADCSCPNQRRTHPHNLVSQRFGDLVKVSRIKQWLDRNPTPEREPEEVVAKINREFPELGWDLPTLNTARAVLPAFVSN